MAHFILRLRCMTHSNVSSACALWQMLYECCVNYVCESRCWYVLFRENKLIPIQEPCKGTLKSQLLMAPPSSTWILSIFPHDLWPLDLIPFNTLRIPSWSLPSIKVNSHTFSLTFLDPPSASSSPYPNIYLHFVRMWQYCTCECSPREAKEVRWPCHCLLY